MTDRKLSPEQVAENRYAIRHLRIWIDFRHTTQKAVADALGVSEPTVSKWLNGQQSMTVAQFSAIARFLGASPEEVMLPPEKSPEAQLLGDLARAVEGLDAEALAQIVAMAAMIRDRSNKT